MDNCTGDVGQLHKSAGGDLLCCGKSLASVRNLDGFVLGRGFREEGFEIPSFMTNPYFDVG